MVLKKNSAGTMDSEKIEREGSVRGNKKKFFLKKVRKQQPRFMKHVQERGGARLPNGNREDRR